MIKVAGRSRFSVMALAGMGDFGKISGRLANKSGERIVIAWQASSNKIVNRVLCIQHRTTIFLLLLLLFEEPGMAHPALHDLTVGKLESRGGCVHPRHWVSMNFLNWQPGNRVSTIGTSQLSRQNPWKDSILIRFFVFHCQTLFSQEVPCDRQSRPTQWMGKNHSPAKLLCDEMEDWQKLRRKTNS